MVSKPGDGLQGGQQQVQRARGVSGEEREAVRLENSYGFSCIISNKDK